MQPLADIMRPKALAEVIGQEHLLGINMPIYNLLQAGTLPSMILWGPPGSGKTTLAKILIKAFDCHSIELSAVFSGVKEIRAALTQAEQNQQSLFNKPTVLFIDEIHRFNKAQQDAFLHHLESGLITIIGATTENPSFEINKALLSRLQVFVLKNLTRDNLSVILDKALAYKKVIFKLTVDAKASLCDLAAGDARRLLNLCEVISNYTGGLTLDLAQLKLLLPKNLAVFDKGGEEFYNQISALHKSVRGSNPNAALYWFYQMLSAGCDPLYIARRLLRIAWEDIGLSDINAGTVVLNAINTYERLGSPEGELALVGAVIYLASTTKSNSLELAEMKLKEYFNNNSGGIVPLHLRNAPTQLMANLGYAKNYKYPHDYPNHYVPNEKYFPEEVMTLDFYQPSSQGLEAKINARLQFLKELDLTNY